MEKYLIPGSLILWTIVESIWPRVRYGIVKKEFFQDLFWLIFNDYLLGWILILVKLGTLSRLDSLVSPVFDLMTSSFVLNLFIALVLEDIVRFLTHYLCHSVPLFWNIHKLHHSTVELTSLSSARGSWMEDLLGTLVISAPLRFLGVPLEILYILMLKNAFYGHFLHANINFNPKFMSKVLCTPIYHQWHHAKELKGKYGQNFGVTFPIWDILVGTAYFGEQQPEDLGLASGQDFPQSIPQRLIYPIQKIFRINS